MILDVMKTILEEELEVAYKKIDVTEICSRSLTVWTF